MQIRCASCGRVVTVAQTGLLPEQCPHCSQAPVPDRIDKWRIVRLIAAGGMGEVYAAAHVELGTEVAIKLLPPLPGSNASSLRERFLREARLTAAVDHPGVVRVFDCASAGDRLYLLLELVPGRSLRSLLKQGPLPVAEAARIAAEVADVLAAAHRKGVVHRDVKPDNVLLQPDGRVRVLDFGIARALQDQEPITHTGEILGTPEYMAPEQLLDTASEIDARTDVHALGLLLYELLTGRSPFQGGTMFQALKLVESLQPPPPSRLRPGLPPALDAVVLRALEKDRERRFPDAGAFAAAVRAAVPAVGAQPTPAVSRSARRRPGHATTFAVLLFVLGVVLFTLRHSGGQAPSPHDQQLAAVQEIERRLPRSTMDADDVARLRRAVRDLDDAADPAQLALRGKARLQLGQFVGAVDDLDRAHGAGDCAVAAAAAWHAVYTLLPQLAGVPPWLCCVDVGRRNRLCTTRIAEGGWAPTDEDGCLLTVARDLANGDRQAASVTVHVRNRAFEAALLRQLAVRAACADRKRCSAILAAGPGGGLPVRLLAEADQGTAPAELLRDLANGCEPSGADRWLCELLASFCECRDGNGRSERMQAAAELAWLCGAGEASTVWFAGLRLHLAGLRPAQHRLDPQEAQRLFRLCSQTDAADCPSVLPLRALLLLAANGTEAAEGELHKMTGAPDARLGWFARWRDAVADDQPAVRAAAWVLIGRPDVARPPAAQHKAQLVLALTATDAPAAERAFADALASGADWSLFELRPPEPPIAVRRSPAEAKADQSPAPTAPGRRALRGAILQRLAAGADRASLLPALRALALWGENMPSFLAEPACAPFTAPPWSQRYDAEVCGGAR